MAEEKEKRKDWTKVDVKTIRKYLPKILLLFVIILLPIYIGYLLWANSPTTNQNVNSGVTTETKTYGVHIENKTSEANKTGTVSYIDFNNTTDLFKLFINWFPLIFGLYFLVRVFGFLMDRD